jgi:hypothetical protein
VEVLFFTKRDTGLKNLQSLSWYLNAFRAAFTEKSVPKRPIRGASTLRRLFCLW